MGALNAIATFLKGKKIEVRNNAAGNEEYNGANEADRNSGIETQYRGGSSGFELMFHKNSHHGCLKENAPQARGDCIGRPYQIG
ncbi:hypothetical protein RsS62_51420 [Rhizobium dioscoreae]|nr:hypothetical protein RsS62_51420 [Rhizobium dioscoreae]